MMKLIITIVRDIDAEAVVEQLIAHGYGVTRVVSFSRF